MTSDSSPFDPTSILLTDRVAVVTGAARGIGRATALAMARFGAHVAVCDRDADGLASTVTEVHALGRRAVHAVIDVRDGDAVRAHIGDVVDTFGRIDVVVNNAGGTFFADFLDMSDKGQAAIVAENFATVTNVTRACVAHMTNGGSIVNVTSIEAHQAAPGFAVYAAMKAGQESLTKSLALELADRGIRVNSIAPDAIPTPGDDALGHTVRESLRFDPTYVPPLGFMGDADDCAAAIVFLASDMSKFVTGTCIHVDGGNRASGGWRREPTSMTYRT